MYETKIEKTLVLFLAMTLLWPSLPVISARPARRQSLSELINKSYLELLETEATSALCRPHFRHLQRNRIPAAQGQLATRFVAVSSVDQSAVAEGERGVPQRGEEAPNAAPPAAMQ